MMQFEKEDLELVLYNMGQIIMVISPVFLLPLLAVYYYGESEMSLYFFGSSFFAFMSGLTLRKRFRTEKEMKVRHAVIMTALSYITISLLSAIPLLYVSPTFLDAFFESVSGWTTTGLSTIASNADSFPKSVNLWRHMMQYFGGFGIVVMSLVVLSRAKTGIGSTVFYLGEGRTEKIGTSIVSTTKAMFFIYLMFSVFSAFGLYLAGAGVFDAICHSMAGVSTGGFSTHAESIQYFKSIKIELVTMLIMTIGSMNFVLHHAIITGKFKEILKNIEMRSFVFFLSLFSVVTIGWLAYNGRYPTFHESFRFGFYQVISGLTTTGWMTQSSAELNRLWIPFAHVLVGIVMVIGASTGSTGGGIKLMRVSLVFKSVWWNIKKTLYPESAVIVKRIHHVEEKEIDDSMILEISAMVFTYLVLLLISTLFTAAYGYSLAESFFESSSALGTVGLSVGVTSLSMPTALKFLYIVDMIAGRLEVLPIIVVSAAFLSEFFK